MNSSKIRLGYMTTIAEITSRGEEFVGQEQILCPEKNIILPGRRIGHLESLVNDIHQNRDGIGDLFEIGAVVYDDTTEQMKNIGFKDRQPIGELNWPWPENLAANQNKTLNQITHQIPMYTQEWKQAMQNYKNNQSEANKQTCIRIRESREQELYSLLRRENIQVLLTDSVTYIFKDGMAMLNNDDLEIVNIHPAITDGEYAIPGLYPTSSAIARYRRGVIFGKKAKEIPVPHLKGYAGHGATLHKTIAAIDEGKIIHSIEDPNLIEPEMSQQELRGRVFEISRRVVREGLIKYARDKMKNINPLHQHTPSKELTNA